MASRSPTLAWNTEDLEAPVQGQPITEAVKVKACSGQKVMPMPSGLDLDGDGVISLSEARSAKNQIVTLRRGFFLVLAMLGVQQVMMFGTVYWATQLASEVHVRNSELQDHNGHSVSTVSRRDRIDGLHYPQAEDRRLRVAARRLNETGSNSSDSGKNTTDSGIGAGGLLMLNETGSNASDSFDSESGAGDLRIVNESTSRDSGFHGRLEISEDYFQSTWTGYMSGKSDWVVPFPDGSVRTVFIQGMSATFAWGICGACPGGTVQWEARCPAEDDPNECSVEYHDGRRLSVVEEEAVPESPLLARARAQRQDDGDGAERDGMERSLGGKHCA